MATLAGSRIFPPKSWIEFQDITRDALAIKWRSPNLQINGRQGQTQHGVDIYGADDLGRKVGIECKNYSDQISITLIQNAVKHAETFTPALSGFYMATSTQRDSTLQKDVRLLSEARININKFPVGIFFWEDLVSDLVTDLKVFQAHFPQIQLNSPLLSNKASRLTASFELGFFGLNLKAFIELILGPFGQMANEKPEQISFWLNNATSSLSIWGASPELTRALHAKQQLEHAVLDFYYGRIDPSVGSYQIDVLVQEFENLISNYQTKLHGEELAIFILGQRLGRWEYVLDAKLKGIPDQFAQEIVRGLKIAIRDKASCDQAIKLVQRNINTPKESVASDDAAAIRKAVTQGLQDQAITTSRGQ